MARDRKLDVQSQIDRLERKHGQLAVRVDQLERHTFLSANERLLVTSLKKEKLATKDALTDLKRC